MIYDISKVVDMTHILNMFRLKFELKKILKRHLLY